MVIPVLLYHLRADTARGAGSMHGGTRNLKPYQNQRMQHAVCMGNHSQL